MRVLKGHGHKRTVVGPAHPALDCPRYAERLEDFADGREVALAADDHRGVVLADVAPGDEGELVCAGDGADLAGQAREHTLDGVAVGRAHKDEHIVDLFGGVEGDALVLLNVLDLEGETEVKRLADNEP